jgi:hypothetical protein
MNMITRPGYSYNEIRALSETQDDKWRSLCAGYLPIALEDSIWRYSRESLDDDPTQGWKLHISATILNANTVFETVAPYLNSCGILFKAPRSLQELQKINSGLFYGYCQVGKFITVYPRSGGEAVLLARRLHQLTCGMRAPAVPFDLRFRSDGCVYYRYGSFEPLVIENPDGTQTPAMRDRDGKLVPDVRDSETAKPHWVTNPFIDEHLQPANDPVETPLKTTFRAFQALAQRGKGGVYKALDFSVDPPRLSILKEGRRDGEITWDGRDGYWRVEHEEQVLTSLRATCNEVPDVYASFQVGGNYYLVMEFIEGETLYASLLRRQKRLTVSRVLEYGIQISALLSRIHSAGWVWRDCKPTNIMVIKKGRLRPLDFEGACLIDSPDPMPWNTPAFVPPEQHMMESGWSQKYEDLYALGAVIYFLLTGRLPDASAITPLEKLRKNVPQEVRDLVGELLGADPRRCPEAHDVRQRLIAALSLVGRSAAK